MSTKELQSIDLGKLAKVTGGNIVAPQSTQMNTMLQEITSALASLGGGSSTSGIGGAMGLGGTSTAVSPTNGSSSMDQMMSMMMMMMGRGGGSPFGGNSGGFPF